MKKKFRILKNKIRNAFKKRGVRLASVSLVSVVLATAVIGSFMGADGEGDNTLATLETKDYIDLIIQQMQEVNNDDDTTNDKDFTILEIVPYEGMAEFYHYVHHDAVTDGLAKHLEDSGDTWFKTYAEYSFQDYQGLANFEYRVMYRSNEEEYYVRSSEYFLKYILPEYAHIIDKNLKVNVCEANDLTVEEVNEADLIIVQTGIHDQQTLAGYHDWADVEDIEVFKKDGSDAYTLNNGTVTGSATYATYEDISDIIGTAEADKYADREKYTVSVTDEKGFVEEKVLISRDLSWEATEALMDVSLVGRTFTVDGETKNLRTPVIMDNQDYGSLAGTYTDSNIYKYITLERLLGPAEEGYKATYATIKEGFTFDYNNLDNNTKNQFGVATAGLQFKNSDSCSTYWPLNTSVGADGIYNYYIDYYKGNPDYYQDGDVNSWSVFSFYYNTVTNGANKIYQMYSPNNSIVMTDNYWIHSGGSCLIPANIESTYTSNNENNGFTAERVGDTTNVTVVNIMRYLLGTTPDRVPETIDETIQILEIEPANQFKYDRFEYAIDSYGGTDGVKVLAEAMGYDTTGWTESNYTDYIQVTCVSTDTFNSLNEDLIATYDMIYFGMQYDKTLTANGTSTIYNDTKLNGYVYLAYGDLIKVSNVLTGLLESDYGVVGDPSTITTAGYTKIDMDPDTGKVTDGERIAWGETYDYYKLYPAGTSKWNDYLNTKLTSGLYYVMKDLNQVFKDDWGYYKVNNTEYYANQLGNARLDGNDITEKKYNELIEYMEADKVFLMDDSVYYLDTTKIYETSNSYKIFEKISLGNYWKGYPYEESFMIPKAVICGVPEITFTEKPIEIEYDANDLVSAVNPDQNVNERGYQLRYTFDLRGEANTAYNIKLVLDKDGDGLYDQEIRTDDTNEMYYEIESLKLDGSGYANGIEIEVTLPTELTGPVAWQVQATKLVSGKETVLKGIETGYTAVMGETRTAKVLQIYPTRDLLTNLCTLNMETNEDFQKLLNTAGAAINFDIQVNAITAKEFEALYRANPDYKIADEYTMVVLGFADIYDLDDISNDYGALDGLQEFIANGGSTLFAHDMTSFITTPNYVTGKFQTTKVYASTKEEYNDTTEFPETDVLNEYGLGYGVRDESKENFTSKVLTYYEFANRQSLKYEVGGVDGASYANATVPDATKYDVINAITSDANLNQWGTLPRREYETRFTKLYLADKDKMDAWLTEARKTDPNIEDVSISGVGAVAISELASITDGQIYYYEYTTGRIKENYNTAVMAVDVTDYVSQYATQIASVCGATYECGGRYYVFVKHRKITVQVINEYTYHYKWYTTYVPNSMADGGVPFQSIWSYNITKTFRNTLGMDKYGVTLVESDREAQNKTKPYYLAPKSTAYTKISSDGKYYVEEIQGFTDLFLYRFAYAGLSTYASNSPSTLVPYQGFTFTQSTVDAVAQDYGLTTLVTKINEGQITQYPYSIPTDLTVSKTHAQNYALDLEEDPEGDDIVVWYTLEYDGSTDETNYYKYTSKDGALNYYIYSKGNITYSGAGHSAIASIDEMKLFVNTIIRAITAGNTAPNITIDNGNKANDGSYVVYRDEFESEYVMLFTPKDTDLLTGYGKFSSGKITCVYTKDGVENTVVLATYGDGALICGNQYELQITDQDIIDAIERKQAQFIFEVSDTYGAAGETKAVFSTRKLFELD